MKREILGAILMLLLTLYAAASISWYSGGNILDGGSILLAGIMIPSAGGAGALLFYRWRMRTRTMS